MNILIFRTDIKTTSCKETIQPLLNNHPTIQDWSVDTEDIDNVLRIEHSGILRETDIIQLMKTYGFNCQQLTD